MWKCPECESELTTILYDVNTNGWETGIAYLTDNPTERQIERGDISIINDYDAQNFGDHEWGDEMEYKCPECDCLIDEGNITWEREEYQEPENKITDETGMIINPNGHEVPKDFEETEHNIIRPETDMTPSDTHQINNSSIICKKCFHRYVHTTEKSIFNQDPDSACPKCRTENTIKEYLSLLNKGFFDKKPTKEKKYVKQKNKP